MPARDLYHDSVRRALERDGWTITHDPLRIPWGGRDVYVDLGAERLLAAEKAGKRIAVEIKGFLRQSDVQELEHSLGQYLLYRSVLAHVDPSCKLYLAVPSEILSDIFSEPLGELMRKDYNIQLIGFDPELEEIVEWIP